MMRELEVYIAGTRAGTLTQDDTGARSFSYEPTYDGPPLSLSMPVANRTYRTRVVDAYLLGLLPDDEHVTRFASLAQIETEECFNLMANLCERIVTSSTRVVEETSRRGFSGVDELAERLLPRLESCCRQTLQRL
ncbi:MAG: HipA N-terminal domain-containing protein [Atopobiaceae bacterium]|nr:HipA N-terminal domain-containing protein [Atopobiaceae bacterium]